MQHTASQFSLTNRYGLRIVGDILIPELQQESGPKGLAFLLHGLGSFRKKEFLQTLVHTFLSNGYAVVNFDATNSTGESGGRYEDATMGKHHDDLVDVIAWAKTQPWFIPHFILCGHSLGGYAVARYAEDHPEEVRGILSLGGVVSGELTFEANERYKPGKLAEWKESGWFIRTSHSTGRELRLPWSHMEERLSHDLRPNAGMLTMPVLIIVGTEDDSCPPDHQQAFFDLIPSTSIPPKELHVLDGIPHTLKSPEDIGRMNAIVDAWVKKLG